MDKLTQQTKRTITYLVTALAIFAMGLATGCVDEQGRVNKGQYPFTTKSTVEIKGDYPMCIVTTTQQTETGINITSEDC